MPATEPQPYISARLQEAVETGVDVYAPVMGNLGRKDRTREAWDSVEGQLIDWGRNPCQLDEEGTQTPSGETIKLAIQLAAKMSQQGLPAPTRVVPDAHGGIVFERQGRSVFESIHVTADTNIEIRIFEDHRLLRREPWVLNADEHER